MLVFWGVFEAGDQWFLPRESLCKPSPMLVNHIQCWYLHFFGANITIITRKSLCKPLFATEDFIF